MRSLGLVLVLSACGASEDPAPGDAPPVVVPCTPSDDTVALATDSSWQLGAAAVDDAGPWFVLAKQRDSATDFVIVDRAGEGATLIPGIANASGQNVATVEVGGKRCIAMHTFDEKFHFACEGGSVEIPGLDLGGRMNVVQVNSTTHVFGQDFAAYHELRRSGGSWGEVEKFESSISKSEDAVRFQSGVASCFLNIDDHASIDTLQGEPVYGEGVATWCRLMPGPDNELGVLTDIGLTTFTGGTLGGWQPTAADVRPLAVGRRGGEMFAVIDRDDRIELQPLPTGTPTVLRTVSSSETAQATIDGDRVIVTSVKSTFEAGEQHFELTASTRCME